MDPRLKALYGLALLSRVTRFRDGQPDLASVPKPCLEACLAGAREGREIPEPPGSVAATHREAVFEGFRYELAADDGADDAKKFAVASMRFYAGSVVRRYRFNPDTWEYEPYDMVLSMDDGAADLRRLNNGAPFLDAHSSWRLENVLGKIREGTAAIRDSKSPGIEREGVADVQFSRRDSVKPIVQDVEDLVLRHVSVGFDILEDKWEERADAFPLRTVTKWEPFEVSLVPMGADDAAVFFSAFADRFDKQEVTTMPNDKTTNPTAAELEAARLEGARLEAERQAGIRLTARTLKFSESASPVKELLDNSEITLTDAQAQLIRAAADRDDKGSPQTPAVSFGREESETFGKAIVRGLLHRFSPAKHKLEDGAEDPARQFAVRPLLWVAEQCLQRAGVDTRFMGSGEIADRSLMLFSGTGGLTTSDFPLLLADAVHKTARRAYDEEPHEWERFVRIVEVADFKTVHRIQGGDFPELLPLTEHGEYQAGSFGEEEERYKLATFGRKVVIDRKTIINDDMDEVLKRAERAGIAGRAKEADLVYGIFTNNPKLVDGKDLFHADHKNLSTDAGAPNTTRFGEARKGMRKQKGVDDRYFTNILPRFIIAGADHETTIDKEISTNLLAIAKTSDNVTEFVRSLTPIINPRLDEGGATAWFMSADPAAIDTIEVAYLRGERGLQVVTLPKRDPDGLVVLARLDVQAAPIDHRGLWKNAGA